MFFRLFSGKLAHLHRAWALRWCLGNNETSMYEKHFGLSKNPFQSVAEGEAVFEGPEQSKVISDLKTALSAKDSIAVITGPVGVGKTTIVQRALEQSGPDRLVAILGRIQVGSDELVDLLLAQFGSARDSERRFDCLENFERILAEKAEAGARVFIVIEDAERLGAELLEELEALTAADGGARAGANIIMMGPQKLDKLIATPALERVRQRIRLQQSLERFTAEEVESYLRHRIKVAGGDFDAMFEQGVALMVRRCSGGIPRVINSLCETALTMAAEHKVHQVSGKIVFKVAVEVFGMAPGHAQAAQGPKATAAPNPAVRPAGQPEPAPAVEESADPTIPVKTIPAAAESTPVPQQASTPRAPKPPANAQQAPAKPAATNGAGASAAVESKPAADLPPQAERPKFQFADEIIVDRNTQTNVLEPAPDKADPPAVKNDAPKPLAKPPAPAAKAAPTPAAPAPAPAAPAPAKAAPAPVAPAPAKAAPTPATPAPAEAAPTPAAPAPAKAAPTPAAPASAKAAPTPAAPAPAEDIPTLALEDSDSPADISDQKSDDSTASFAKVDHDMLDAALASLAVHDDEDTSEPEEPVSADDSAPESIPEVTLDKSIEAKRAKATAPTDPAELDKMAAELEQTKSLEEMSDQLAETLFGSEELESISLQIREEAAPAEENPVALEPAEATDAAKPSPAPEPKEAPKSPPAPAPAANIELGNETAAAATPTPQQSGPQPEPIENQFNTSMTATLKTLDKHTKSPDDAESEERSGGLLGRLKDTFKS